MWDAVYAWLLTNLATITALSDHVYDGEPVTRDQLLAYAVVGDEEAGNYSQDTDPTDTLIAETGEIEVRFVSRSGDDDLVPHRVATKAWVDALTAAFKADQTLGGTLRKSSTVYVGRVEVQQQKTSGGVRVQRTATVTYFTRL